MIDWLQKHLFTCSFKSFFGIDCPGCGSQRALISLLQGDIAESISYHAALIPFIITIILLIVQLFKKHENGGTWVMWSFTITSAITLIQYIIKQVLIYN